MSRESRSVFLLLALAVAGHGVRLALQPSDVPPGQLLADATLRAQDPARQHARAVRAARPLGASEKIDVNSAPAEEIARLPRIGMSLAKRIVMDRTERGPFRDPADLDRVPGIGPTLLQSLVGRLQFGGAGAGFQGGETAANSRTPGGYAIASQPVAGELVDLNSAAQEGLRALPGIGRVRALAILAYRRENGPFAAVSDLERVPGFSRGLVARLASRLTVR